MINHANGEVIWAGKNRSPETLSSFFETLTAEQRQKITTVTCDGAGFIHDVVAKFCPNAKICLDPFHVFQWLTEDADTERKVIKKEMSQQLAELKRERKELNDKLKGSSREAKREELEKYDIAIKNLEDDIATLHNDRHLLAANPANLGPEDLPKRKSFLSIDKKLERIAEKIESFRDMMHLEDLNAASKAFDKYVGWAKRCKLKSFKRRAKTLEKFKDKILNTMECGVSNGVVEATNNIIKALKRQAFGFRNMDNLFQQIKIRCSKRYINLQTPSKLGRCKSNWKIYRNPTAFAV